jgi:hypothetical protein
MARKPRAPQARATGSGQASERHPVTVQPSTPPNEAARMEIDMVATHNKVWGVEFASSLATLEIPVRAGLTSFAARSTA